MDYHARLAQSVEHQTFNLRVAGSSPSSGVYSFFNRAFEHSTSCNRINRWSLESFNQKNGSLLGHHARLAQSVEHQTFNLRVAGSSPSSGEQTFYRNVGITRPSIERWVCSFLETNSVSVATNDFQ